MFRNGLLFLAVAEKTEAALASLRAGFATHLVTDEQTAKRLMRREGFGSTL